ncbi:MAG: hypothetical protein LUD81_05560 [Clostridiales bacterium]|nr:hypothetical protein [Clostridiales bacterium]
MNLRKFEGKNVRIIDTEKDIYEGYVGDYIFPEDNEPEGMEAVVLDDTKRVSNPKRFYDLPVRFNANEIKSIELIK